MKKFITPIEYGVFDVQISQLEGKNVPRGVNLNIAEIKDARRATLDAAKSYPPEALIALIALEKKNNLSYAEAHALLLCGYAVARESVPGVIKCQLPDEESANTEPYFYLEANGGDDYIRLPWTPGPLGLFAIDWYVVQ